ncbi:hypothetical protein NLM33_32580 [Bradyrhizobium sp. CCGUVB1N3]|uniref:hypothetical protein n=1 Tax=Bradyrhizobium sp. CCGUVB1N3 TaxID=2949629 RepID=UPI0020B44A2B|nr:hypothetical protein [Bradyrhizobium sp. CCGUVB1N3]MCP3475060.1 hypothetical protein [Bradyrhizobium sp. CCGUVB1N3]
MIGAAGARTALIISSLAMFATSASAEIVAGHANSIDPSKASQLDTCVKQTYGEFVTRSETTCVGNRHEYGSGNTSDDSYSIDYQMGPDFPGYKYIPGSETTSFYGRCTFDMKGTGVQSDTSFVCIWHTAGCGFTKDGGYINGACSVKMHYLPRDGDVAAIKEYCFGLIAGIPIAKPVSYSKGCILP